jgi:hypothetical protein
MMKPLRLCSWRNRGEGVALAVQVKLIRLVDQLRKNLEQKS